MRVLIIQSNSILTAGIISLLQQNENFEVMIASYRTTKDLNRLIDQFLPMAVIIDICIGESKINAMFTLLASHPETRFLVVSLADNRVQIFTNQTQSVNYIDDLINIIQGFPFDQSLRATIPSD